MISLNDYWRHRDGLTIREGARQGGMNASTMMRRIHAVRDLAARDPLIAWAAEAPPKAAVRHVTDDVITGKANVLLRRMKEPGATLIISKQRGGRVMRDYRDRWVTTGEVKREIAAHIVARGWLQFEKTLKDGMHHRYSLTTAGANWVTGVGELPWPRWVARNDVDGRLFAAGEAIRLLWDDNRPAALDVLQHVGELAPILRLVICEDVKLEAAENRLGYSARSGKVVLRMALERLASCFGN